MALDASRAGPAGVPVTWRWIGVLTVLLALSNPAEAHGPEMMTIDRLVAHTSTVPAIKGRRSELLVREKVPTAYVEGNPGSLEGKVVLFVHGGFSPATLAFDVQYRDYSWMEHLAYGGFAVFAMDMTGYGRSTRPLMDDPCNVDPRQQAMLVPRTLKAPCPPSYPFELVTSDSETDDIDAVVEFIRRLRKVERVTLIGWSGGGIRTGTYAARHPGKVDRHVIWASSNYARDNPDGPPAALPRPGAPITLQTREVGIERRWLADVKCDGQVEPGMPELIGALSLQADPVGAQWGPGVLRAPTRTYWGWNAATARRLSAPTLIMVGEQDPLTTSNIELFEDHGAERKLLLRIACGTHFMNWERGRKVMQRATLDWLTKGNIDGLDRGRLRADAAGKITRD
jgi:pimeloyl-ACP methyl ester carboxylesterase